MPYKIVKEAIFGVKVEMAGKDYSPESQPYDLKQAKRSKTDARNRRPITRPRDYHYQLALTAASAPNRAKDTNRGQPDWRSGASSTKPTTTTSSV